MRTELCVFSGLKVYPGHGIRYVPVINSQSTRPIFVFINQKSRSQFDLKKNPRTIPWTAVYRRLHKKAHDEAASKKSSKKSGTKIQRAIAGMSVEKLNALRNESEAVRAAAREAELKILKERQAAKAAAAKEKKDAEKKAAAAKVSEKKVAAPAAKPVQVKPQQQQKQVVKKAKPAATSR